MESNTYDILSSGVTLILPYDCFKSFIARDYLIVSEMRAVLRWIDQNDSNMEKKTELLGCIRLWLISPGDLRSMVMATRLFSKTAIEKAMEMQTCIMPIEGADPRGRVCKFS